MTQSPTTEMRTPGELFIITISVYTFAFHYTDHRVLVIHKCVTATHRKLIIWPLSFHVAGSMQKIFVLTER